MHARFRAVWTALAIAVVWQSAAWGVVTTIDGTVTARIQEFSGSEPLNSDEAFKDFLDTTQTLPLVAEATLARHDESASSVPESGGAAGTAMAILSDPRLAVDPNPEELAIDICAFTTLSSVSHQGSAEVTETRSVVFTSSDIGAEAGAPLIVQSEFFLDGIVVIWAKEAHSIGATQASMSLSVAQTRAGDASPAEVLSATLNLAAASEGNPALTVEGALTAENVSVIDLTGQVAGFEAVYVVVLPDLAIPYTYGSAVEEPFTLQAVLDGAMTNQPGTGAAVILGSTLTELGNVVSQAGSPEMALALKQALLTAMSSGPAPAKPLVSSGEGTLVTVNRPVGGLLGALQGCGAVGAEMALLPLLMATMALIARRR